MSIVNPALVECLERVQKLEVAAAAQTGKQALQNMAQIREYFDLIRANPPKAYVVFMKGAIEAKNAAQCALCARLAGYAQFYMVQEPSLFDRLMLQAERPVLVGVPNG